MKYPTLGLAAVCLACAVLAVPACSTSPSRPEPAESPRTGTAPDPTQGTFFPWKPIDDAVARGAIEHLVVATPTAEVGAQFRTYRLLGPQDQPGILRVERTDDRLAISVSIGRFGQPDLEAAVLESVQRELARAD